MTRAGVAALLGAALTITLGAWLGWLTLDLIGVGLLVAVGLAVLIVLRPSPVSIERSIQPSRVAKGNPALAVLSVVNSGTRPLPPRVVTQPFGTARIPVVLPRLRRGERGLRSYRLPTSQRGIIDVEPIELARRDPFALIRTSRRYSGVERIWVYPRVQPLRALPSGRTQHLDGPSSDTSPQGTITFHRLREYVPGDDLRLVHWRSSARAGHLMVKHNVDTSRPYNVVLLDLRATSYPGSGEPFEEAVDLAASVVVSSSATAAAGTLELRFSDGTVLGGPRLRDTGPLLDHLTTVTALPGDGGTSFREELVRLRRARGGTSLVVVTGPLDASDLPHMVALRRSFERVVIVSIASMTASSTFSSGLPDLPGIRVIHAPTAALVADAWNGHVPR
jgi:uncharacterized protein (DUF58 family)